AFVTLKFHLPSLRAHTKRVSKLKILNAAISYIDSLVAILKFRISNIPTDRSLIQHQTFPYVQSLLDCPPYLCNQTPHTQNFMMNTPFILPSAYHQ
ncbi:hypothetical protein OSTOST_12924, partial [Ostertagia ostertagi]